MRAAITAPARSRSATTRPRWHPAVLRAAQQAAERSGQRFAVLCIACPLDRSGLPAVVGTAPTAWVAAGARNRHAARGPHGNLYDDGPGGPDDPFAFKGIVYVVDDGRIR